MSQDFIPDDQFTPDSQSPSNPIAPASASGQSFIPDQAFVPDEEKFGTLPQQALTVAEGLGKGFVGPVATLAEKGLTSLGVPGLSPEEQAGREAANPIESGAANVGGLGAGIFTGTGEAALLEKAGAGALKLAGVAAKPVTLAGRLGAQALKGAVETSLYQTGDELSNKINNPELSTAGALTHIGLAGLIGAGGGALLGSISPLWKASNSEAVEQGVKDFQNSLDGSVVDHTAEAPLKDIEEAGLSASLRKQKPNYLELQDIAGRNQWPTAEGIFSDSKEIQKAEDSLLNGPPTISSLSRQKLYNDIYDKMETSVDRAISPATSQLSETEAGNLLKQSLSEKLNSRYAPIKALYDEIAPYQEAIPVTERTTGSIARNLEPVMNKLVPGTPRYNYMKSMVDRIPWIDNLQKLKDFRTEVGKSAGIESKDLAGLISDKLDGVEERATQRFAETMKNPDAKQKILGVLDTADKARGEYANFRNQLSTLGDSLGKKKIRGPQDFIDFVDDINPQSLSRKLFNENNTTFAQYFAKEFPEEMNTMRAYQRGLVRQEAMKDGAFNLPRAVKGVLSKEPEMQKLLYSPNELQTIQDADKYYRAFPKAFNPSGTAHESAFRAFFEHPTGAAIANLRDYGIQSFIKAFGKAAPGAEGEADRLIPLMGNAVKDKEVNSGAFKHAVSYAMATIKGENSMSNAIGSLFSAAVPVSAQLAFPPKADLDKLDKKLKDFQGNVDQYSSIGGQTDHYLPGHNIAIKAMTSNAINFLNASRPATVKLSPLDKEIPPSKAAQGQYQRVLAIANQPLSVVGLLRENKLTSSDVHALKTMYPAVYSSLSQKLTQSMTAHLAKGETIPYQLKQGISTFLGQPMDTLMKQSTMQTIISANAPKGPPAQQMPGQRAVSKSTATSMQKVNQLYATPNQAGAARRTASH